MNYPWLSVLIPTYNGADYLPFALDSIIAQGDSNVEGIECIAIDDGSNDSTLAILNSYTDKIPLKIVQRSRIGNWTANTNYALSLANTEYICFLHQDDIWLENRLAIMRNLITRYPENNLFLHPSRFIDHKGDTLGLWQCPLPTYPPLIETNIMTERLLIQNFISIPAPIFKRETALNVGGLDEKLWYTADWDFWLKVAACGKTVYHPKPLAAFRVHPSSQTVLRSTSVQDFQQQLEIVLEKHLNCWDTTVDIKKITEKIALFSIEVNTSLASKIHGQKVNIFKLLYDFLALSPSGWHRYFRDSRIWERVFARVRARLATSSQSKKLDENLKS